MKHHKNRPKSITEDSELVFEEELYVLADAISENSEKTPILSDPFEDYIDGMRTKIHSNPHLFRSRLAKGYNALLKSLQEHENCEEHFP
jgi:hypothetical protein